MNSKRALAVFFLAQLFAMASFAQSAATPSEFGRVSGGELDLITKHGQPWSGSLGISAGSGKGYDASFGGTLARDRVWFFASAIRSEPRFNSQFVTQLPSNAVTSAVDAKLTADLGSRQNLAASFAASRPASLTTAPAFIAPIPSSFLSLHYTGVLSDNMYVTGSFSEQRRSSAGN